MTWPSLVRTTEHFLLPSSPLHKEERFKSIENRKLSTQWTSDRVKRYFLCLSNIAYKTSRIWKPYTLPMIPLLCKTLFSHKLHAACGWIASATQFYALDHMHTDIRGGDIDTWLLQIDTRWIHCITRRCLFTWCYFVDIVIFLSSPSISWWSRWQFLFCEMHWEFIQ